MISDLAMRGVVRALYGYWQAEVRSRLGEIVFTQDFGLALIGGAAIGLLGPSFLTGAPKTLDVVTAVVAYAAIALGFCVGGMTIALTLPNPDFIGKLAKHTVPGRTGSALASLLFVFSWTAVVHWMTIVAALATLLMDGGTPLLFPPEITPIRRTIVGALAFAATYSLLQFLITVLTLSHVGAAYIKTLSSFDKAQLEDGKNGDGQETGTDGTDAVEKP